MPEAVLSAKICSRETLNLVRRAALGWLLPDAEAWSPIDSCRPSAAGRDRLLSEQEMHFCLVLVTHGRGSWRDQCGVSVMHYSNRPPSGTEGSNHVRSINSCRC